MSFEIHNNMYYGVFGSGIVHTCFNDLIISWMEFQKAIRVRQMLYKMQFPRDGKRIVVVVVLSAVMFMLWYWLGRATIPYRISAYNSLDIYATLTINVKHHFIVTFRVIWSILQNITPMLNCTVMIIYSWFQDLQNPKVIVFVR